MNLICLLVILKLLTVSVSLNMSWWTCKVVRHFCSRIGEWSDWSFVAWTGGRAKLIIFPVCGGTGSKFGCWWTVPPVISHISFWSLITLHTWLFWWRVWYFQWPGSQLAIHWNGKTKFKRRITRRKLKSLTDHQLARLIYPSWRAVRLAGGCKERFHIVFAMQLNDDLCFLGR